MPDVIHTALTDFKRVERTKYAGLTSMATIKSRQQHNEDCVRRQIEADQPRSHHRAVDARAVERSQGASMAVAGRVAGARHSQSPVDANKGR
jgi:hypothetical protein